MHRLEVPERQPRRQCYFCKSPCSSKNIHSGFTYNLYPGQMLKPVTIIQPSFMENNRMGRSSQGIQVRSPSKVPLRYLNAISNTKKSQAYMPFLFKANRQYAEQGNDRPAPGQYELKSQFDHSNKRTELEQKYHLVMENTKKIKESTAFKSTAKRFNYGQGVDNVPISYSYRLGSRTGSKDNSSRSPNKFKHQASKTATLFNATYKYPSIPDHSLSYGYLLGNDGKLKKIDKTEQQLEHEKEDMKKYVRQLSGEKGVMQSPVRDKQCVRTKSNLVEELKQKISMSKNESFLSASCISQCSEKSPKSSKRPFLMKNTKCNIKRVHKVIAQKAESSQLLGPGSYDVNKRSFGEILKPQRFQFFNSTAERFKANTAQKPLNLQKKAQIAQRFEEAQRKRYAQFKRGLKKNIRYSEQSQRGQKQNIKPGPGDYDPLPIPRKTVKNSLFQRSKRFEQNSKEDSHDYESKKYSDIDLCQGKNVTKQQKASIIPKFKTSKKKKTWIEKQRQDKIKSKGQSEYSICQWQNRPLSRNEGFNLKDSTKNYS